MKRNLFTLALVAALAVGSTACSSATRPVRQLGARMFTHASMGDMELKGIKSGEVVPLNVTAATRDAATAAALDGLLNKGSVGVLLPVTPVGEREPWWILCTAGDMEKQCRSIPANASVTFSGTPLGKGSVLLPSRLTWSAE